MYVSILCELQAKEDICLHIRVQDGILVRGFAVLDSWFVYYRRDMNESHRPVYPV